LTEALRGPSLFSCAPLLFSTPALANFSFGCTLFLPSQSAFISALLLSRGASAFLFGRSTLLLDAGAFLGLPLLFLLHSRTLLGGLRLLLGLPLLLLHSRTLLGRPCLFLSLPLLCGPRGLFLRLTLLLCRAFLSLSLLSGSGCLLLCLTLLLRCPRCLLLLCCSGGLLLLGGRSGGLLLRSSRRLLLLCCGPCSLLLRCASGLLLLLCGGSGAILRLSLLLLRRRLGKLHFFCAGAVLD
jgi:hypothetical protein